MQKCRNCHCHGAWEYLSYHPRSNRRSIEEKWLVPFKPLGNGVLDSIFLVSLCVKAWLESLQDARQFPSWLEESTKEKWLVPFKPLGYGVLESIFLVSLCVNAWLESLRDARQFPTLSYWNFMQILTKEGWLLCHTPLTYTLACTLVYATWFATPPKIAKHKTSKVAKRQNKQCYSTWANNISSSCANHGIRNPNRQEPLDAKMIVFLSNNDNK